MEIITREAAVGRRASNSANRGGACVAIHVGAKSCRLMICRPYNRAGARNALSPPRTDLAPAPVRRSRMVRAGRKSRRCVSGSHHGSVLTSGVCDQEQTFRHFAPERILAVRGGDANVESAFFSCSFKLVCVEADEGLASEGFYPAGSTFRRDNCQRRLARPSVPPALVCLDCDMVYCGGHMSDVGSCDRVSMWLGVSRWRARAGFYHIADDGDRNARSALKPAANLQECDAGGNYSRIGRDRSRDYFGCGQCRKKFGPVHLSMRLPCC